KAWLCGCGYANALFCFLCLLFKTTGTDPAWTAMGVRNMKHVSEKVRKHENTGAHMDNSVKLAILRRVNIATQLDDSHSIAMRKHNEEVDKNRYILSKNIYCVKFCWAFELALREHDETDASDNPGVFRGLVDFVAYLDIVLKTANVFKINTHHPPNAGRFSQWPVNLSILPATLADANSNIQERFFEFITIQNATAHTIATALLDRLSTILPNGHKAKLIAQAYDGAAVMRRGTGGVQRQIMDIYESVHYVHCYAHQLNLIMQQATSHIPRIGTLFSDLVGSAFLSRSPKQFLSLHDTEKLIHAFVTSRLDYCNAILSGGTNRAISVLQLVQNAAARILTKTLNDWHNSIRHNLSLHDMFIRETSPDGKISYWTIRPEANRCLTLDQVYKPVMDPAIPSQVHTVQVCEQQHQKRVLPETNKSALPCGSERKMKPLLPRTDSYLVPFQLPLNPPIILPAATQLPLSAAQHNSSSTSSSALRCGKRVRIAPKIPQTSEASALIQPQREPWKDKQLYVCGSQTPEAPVDILPRERKETSSSRRKQRLVLPSAEEPVLLFPESSFIDSGLASDLSAFQDTREVELESPVKEYAFKTPIKGGLPASSTPSKAISGEPPVVPGLWRTTPLSKRSHGVLDFSPIRTPRGVSLTPQREDQTPFSFSSTPFKELPLFDSPRELLNTYSPSSLSRLGASSPIPESDGLKQCSHELQGGLAGANRSLTEGLVLDTMNDSLSKILVDISFTGLEDEDLGMGNISWSQLIPELK
ncbi:FOXM1 protein, partial [Amia calva]|nr:FOXM1 protein [Amia calva]